MSGEGQWVGIDVSKARLDVALDPAGGPIWPVTNDVVAGITELVERLHELGPQRIVLEATGGFEIALAATLASHDVPVVIVNPRQVRDFARATGQLAKNRSPGRARPGPLRRSDPT